MTIKMFVWQLAYTKTKAIVKIHKIGIFLLQKKNFSGLTFLQQKITNFVTRVLLLC